MKTQEIKAKFPRLEFDASGTERLQEILVFLEKRKELEPRFMKRLQYLNDYAGDRSQGCRLYKDFSPLSFEIVMLDAKGGRWFNGGLIYHGRGDDGVGGPSYSVRLGDLDEDWSIHT